MARICQQALTEMEAVAFGTSMATPIAAGSATLVRQYFTDGWYPTGQPNASAAFGPSASLVKAVLIGGHSSCNFMLGHLHQAAAV